MPRTPFGAAALVFLCSLGTVALPFGVAPLHAQDASQFAGMQHVAGVITAISGDTVSVKDETGAAVKIVTTSNTRVMKSMGVAAKLVDLKAGDGVFAVGNLDEPNKTLHAAFLVTTDAAQVKKMREDLGKTYIAGKVTAIDADNLKMIVLRPDGVSQTIGFDDSTSFKRGRVGRRGGMGAMGGASAAPAASGESITLADIKVGDQVAGQGALKSGTFVPAQLVVSTPGEHGSGASGAGAATQPK